MPINERWLWVRIVGMAIAAVMAALAPPPNATASLEAGVFFVGGLLATCMAAVILPSVRRERRFSSRDLWKLNPLPWGSSVGFLHFGAVTLAAAGGAGVISALISDGEGATSLLWLAAGLGGTIGAHVGSALASRGDSS